MVNSKRGGEYEAVNVSYDLCSLQHQYSSKFQDNNVVYIESYIKVTDHDACAEIYEDASN